MKILYFLITLFATTIGSATGMGGGVIIKPVLDAFRHFNIETINTLSSISVFTMSVVSVIRNIINKDKAQKNSIKDVLSIAFGSMIGGYVGTNLFNKMSYKLSNNMVTLVQNGVLIVLIIIIYFYIKNKDDIPSLNFGGLLPVFIVGLFLGMTSSFLGIGGGPINVAILIYVLGYTTKTSTSISLITIFFSQASKLTSMMLSTGFAQYDLTMLPFMLVGAVLGGFIGSDINKRLSEDRVDILFNRAQLLIMGICIFNIIKSIA